MGQVASGLVSTGDEWRIDWVARREQDRKRRKYSVLQPFSAVAVALEFRGFADLNRPVQANATSVKESTISRTVESIEVRLNYIQFLAALVDRASRDSRSRLSEPQTHISLADDTPQTATYNYSKRTVRRVTEASKRTTYQASPGRNLEEPQVDQMSLDITQLYSRPWVSKGRIRGREPQLAWAKRSTECRP